MFIFLSVHDLADIGKMQPQMVRNCPLGIAVFLTVQLPHTDRKVPVGCFDKKVRMVVHKTVTVTDPIVASLDMLEGVQKVGTILIALEDSFLFVAAGCDVVDSAGVLYTEGTGHSKRISEAKNKVKDYRPDPGMFRKKAGAGWSLPLGYEVGACLNETSLRQVSRNDNILGSAGYEPAAGCH